MKNWLLNTLRTAVILLSATLLITSCQQSDFDEPLLDGETVTISFKGSIDSQAQSRAWEWDGGNVDVLYFELYIDNNRIERKEFEVTQGNIVNFEIDLLKNMTYTAVFWAQNKNCSIYSIDNLAEISINYNTSVGADIADIENNDAFHAAIEFTVNPTTIQEGVDVKLTRPFALIIAGVNDFTSGETSITVSKVATKFNAFNYEASAEESKTFNFTPDGTTTVPGKSHKMIGMAYVLPLKDTVTTVTVKTPSKESSINLEKLEANKRYNILSAQ